MWNIGNQMAKQWCNAIQNLSLPAFNDQINLMKRMIEGATKNEVVVFDLPNRNGTIDTPDRELSSVANEGSRQEISMESPFTPSTTPSKKPTNSKASSVASEGCRENSMGASCSPLMTPSKKRTYSKGQQISMEDELKTLSKFPNSPTKKQKTD